MSNTDKPPVRMHVSGTAQEPVLGPDYNALTLVSFDEGGVLLFDGGERSVYLYGDQVDALVVALQRHKERTGA